MLAWTFGTLFALLTPPFQVPDEYVHFYRAYSVSRGQWIAVKEGSAIGGVLPKSLVRFADEVSRGIPFHPERKQDLNRLLSMRHMPLHPRDREFVDYCNSSWHSTMNYLPQAAGMALARKVGLTSPLWILYAGRLGNMLVWSALIYAALSITPVLHWTLCLLALMPMSLAQASSNSADGVVNGTCFLYLATVFKFALGDKRPMSPGRIVALMALGAAVAQAKTAYFPLTLMFLTIPDAKFGGRNKKWLLFGVFLIISAASGIGWLMCTYGSQTYVAEGINPREQMLFMLHHPFYALWRYVITLVHTPFLASIVGRLGWYDTRLNIVAVLIYVGVLVWTMLLGGEISVQRWQKWIAAIAAAGCIFAVFTLIYLTFSEVGSKRVEALQGRYMIPITPLVALLIYAGPPPRRKPNEWAFTGFSAAFLSYVCFVIVLRFYVG